jgi:hypothetical protein
MSITRDIIQGFIDGYIVGGGDILLISNKMSDYLSTHPDYPTTGQDLIAIISDINSYRISSQKSLGIKVA